MIEIMPFLMVIAIVAVVQFNKTQRLRLQRGDAPDSAEAEALRGEVRRLGDRVAVLERILTDGDRTRSLALEREIEGLRDAAPPRDAPLRDPAPSRQP